MCFGLLDLRTVASARVFGHLLLQQGGAERTTIVRACEYVGLYASVRVSV